MNINHKRNYKLFIISLLLNSLVNWSCDRDNNKNYPLGTQLNSDLLKKASQIIKTEDDFVIFINTSKYWDKPEYFLFFFDSSRQLYSKCAFPSIRIDSVKNKVFFGTTQLKGDNLNKSFSKKLPFGYGIHLDQFIEGGGGWECNKLVEKILLRKNNLILFVSQSSDLYACGDWAPNEYDSISMKTFIKKDTLEYQLSDISIDYKKQLLQKCFRNESNYLIWDRLTVKNVGLIDSLYSQILKSKF